MKADRCALVAAAMALLGLLAVLPPAPVLATQPRETDARDAEESPRQRLERLRAPELMARAAVLADPESGLVLYGREPHARLPVASLTKMVTALVAIERAPLDLPIRATSLSRSVPSVIGLDPGDVLTLEQLLYGLMLRSGNDAALAIAEALGGSVGAASIAQFVELMNQKVRSLGLRDTHFANPSGLEAEGHESTAYDMAQVARAYLAVPTLAKIAATRRFEIPGPPLWVFQNSNRFLYTYDGADGIKTGYEDLAGRCLAASATREGRRLIAIVLNSEAYLREASALMDYGFANYASLVANAALRPLVHADYRPRLPDPAAPVAPSPPDLYRGTSEPPRAHPPSPASVAGPAATPGLAQRT